MIEIRRTGAVLAALLSGAALAACGAASGAAGGGDDGAVKVLFTGPVGANPYSRAELDGAREIAARHGVQLDVADPGFDAAKQDRMVQDALTRERYDGVLAIALSGTAFPALRTAMADGVQVVTTNNTTGPDLATTEPQVGQIGDVHQPPVTKGRLVGDTIVAACERRDPCEAAYIAGQASLAIERGIREGFETVLDAHPAIDLVAYLDGGGYARGPALEVTQDLLQAHPEVDVIATADGALVGARIAIEGAGLRSGVARDEIRLVGQGASREVVDGIRAGHYYATVTGVPRDEGRIAMRLLLEAIDGGLRRPRGVDAVVAGGRPEILDRETLAQSGFEPQYAG